MANNADAVLSQFTQADDGTKVEFTGKKLKVGIIGTGWIAEAHIQSYKNMPDVEVVAAADLIPGKAEAFMKRFGVEGVHFYPSHKEMIDNEQLDAVSVCTYNTAHAVPTIYALEHGVNVLLEKPFTVTTEEAVEVMRAEKKSGKVLSIGFQPRGDENMQMIKKIVQSGVLGKVYYIQTGGGRRRGIPNSTFIEKTTAGIGALGDIGCYSLDVVLNAIGYPKPLTVTGYKSDVLRHQPEVRHPRSVPHRRGERQALHRGRLRRRVRASRGRHHPGLPYCLGHACRHSRRHHHLRYRRRAAHSLHRLLERHLRPAP